MMARDGLAAQLAQLRPEILVLQARDLTEALGLAAEHDDLDAVILAVPAAEDSGLQAIDEFGRARAALPVIVLSASEAARDARAALARGALGYVPKSAGPRTLLSAIRLVLDGERYVPPLILDESPEPARAQPQEEASASRTALTARQTEVLRKLSDGHSNKTIARDLGVAEKTVKAHVTAIFKALHVANRAEATAEGRRAGLV